MTANEWRDHAAKCRFVAETIEEASARRILLEAADDYLATAERERAFERLEVAGGRYIAVANNMASGA